MANYRNKRRNNNKKRPKTRGYQQMGKIISLRSEKAIRNITFNLATFANTTITLYSLAAASDVRFISFQNVLSSTEFTAMQTVYDSYRILEASVMVQRPSATFTFQVPALHIDVDATNATPANPTNSSLVNDDTVKLFSSTSTRIDYAIWKFPGVSHGTHDWYDCLNVPNIGCFMIGNNQITTNVTTVVWEIKFNLLVEFASPT
jgi:hypothetical protein